ncbi:dual 3',5'-cyclic-AMP and -GMP phosphodiesterase 11-like isoform X2 [Chrysoperla carnea]|nr:dual 3',5'-cyclic-AMP and -GMP phosphodiesterase 11-like isoform X2 [Chrysoperla carnea]
MTVETVAAGGGTGLTSSGVDPLSNKASAAFNHRHTQSNNYDPEYARMETWLDEHPDFVQDYFLRKATRQIVDSWLVSHATPTSSSVELSSPTHGPPSRGGSGATTPVRKISAHEFERGGLLKPIVNTIDGTPTFLSVNSQNDLGGIPICGQFTTRPQRRSRNELRHLDEKELIFELVKDICNELDVRSLCHKILQNVSMLLHADRGSLFLVQGERNSINNVYNNNNNLNNSTTPSPSTNLLNNNSILTSSSTTTATQVPRSPSPTDIPPSLITPNNLLHTNQQLLQQNDKIFDRLINPGQFGGNDCRMIGADNKIVQNNNNNNNNLNNNNNNNTTMTSLVLTSNHQQSMYDDDQQSKDTEQQCNINPPTCRYLVSKLFDVCSKSTLVEMEQKEEIRIPWGCGIVGYVAESGESVNIPDAYKDERFNHDIDVRTGYKTKALLAMPIKDTNGHVIGVAQVINKQGDSCFTAADEKVFSSYLQFCGIGLRNAQLYERSQLEVRRNQVLLDLARMIFEEQSTIEHMVFRILTHTQSLIQCQRVQVLLVHQPSKGSFSRVFDFAATDLNSMDCDSRTSPFESRFPINIGITGYVATTGETVNIPNAYEDSRFDPSVDDGTGFTHRSILCMAIKNSCGQIIGVIQLINKFDDLAFTKNDENFVEAFAIFCGMGIHNTHMYEKAVIAIAKQSVTLEVLSYHASASIDDAIRLRNLRVPSAAHYNLHDFKFDDIQLDDDDTLKACLRMFLDLDLLERFHVDRTVLCRWLLSVKKNYRQVTYHNWRHAFNVAQMMFSILTTTQWWKIFGEMECLALMIACLCHDLDHRGTNNSFQIKASSPLAQLYSTSTMEHHHFDQCLMILNSPGNQILSNVSPDEYSRVVKVLEDAILSTDLAVYFRKRGSFFRIVQNVVEDGHDPAIWASEENRELLRAMLMTVCDLAAITKPWDIEYRVAELVSSEFFEQGDIERQELNITPIDLMNREKEDQLPLMQVGFIDSICLPIYEAFAVLNDKLEPLVEGVRDNKAHWLEIAAAKSLTTQNNGPQQNNVEPMVKDDEDEEEETTAEYTEVNEIRRMSSTPKKIHESISAPCSPIEKTIPKTTMTNSISTHKISTSSGPEFRPHLDENHL